MKKVAKVEVLDGFKLRLSFDDGTSGVADLSDLAGQGAFAAWKDRTVFEQVSIGSLGELCWGEEIDLCPDSLYLRVARLEPVDLFPLLHRQAVHA